MACNKDGSLVMTGSVDGSAKLINTVTGKVRQRLPMINNGQEMGFAQVLELLESIQPTSTKSLLVR